MKIWILTTEYPPQYGGGIGTYCVQWCNLLYKNGHDVTVFVAVDKTNGFSEVIQENIRVVYFSRFLSNSQDFLGYETATSHSYAAIVEMMIKKEGVPHWIDTQEYNGIAYYVLQKKHLGYPLFRDLKICVTCHCPSYLLLTHNHVSPYRLPYYFIGEMEKFCIKAADLCISPSRFLYNQLRAITGNQRKFIVIPNPQPVVTEFALPATKRFVFIGKLSPAKGILFLLKSFESLWKEGFDYKLQLIGDLNYYYHALGRMVGDIVKERYSHYIQAGKLQLSGILPPVEVSREVNLALAVIVPSMIENLPYTVLQSMAGGKIVLAAQHGGQSEVIIDGNNGFLFDHDESLSFTSKVHAIAALDTQEVKKIGQAAQETIRIMCDPNEYYNKKISYFESEPQASNQFPFLYSEARQHTNENSNDLLSVVIPYYNLGTLIMETIESIRKSDYPNIEIIVVNDGSDDSDSLAVLELLRKRDDVRVIDQLNEGLSAARNRGARSAQGTFLSFLDADDKVSNTYYSKSVQLIKDKSNVHFVGCWIRYFEESTNVWPAFTPEPPYLLYHNMVNSSSLVYRRESFIAAGLNDARFIYGMEDYDSVINMVKNGYNGVVLPEVLFHYRVRKGSMSSGFNNANKAYLYILLTEKHKDFCATFAAEITGLVNTNGPGFELDNPTLDYHIYTSKFSRSKIIRKMILYVKSKPRLKRLALLIKRKLNT